MVKNITTIIFNSMEAEKTNDGSTNNLYFSIDTPPITVKNIGILKVSNFCHIGEATGHADNMYLFKIRGVIVDNSKCFIGNRGGNFPLILTTTFNNNRSLYDENIVSLTKQTINRIDLIVDTYYPYGIFNNIIIKNGGSGYLVGQILKFTTGDSSAEVFIRISSVNSGTITGFNFISNSSVYSPDILNNFITNPPNNYSKTPYPTLTTFISGSGANLTASMNGTGPFTIFNIAINNGGFGYKQGQTLLITGAGVGGGVATISTVNAVGTITGINLSNGGSYTEVPSISINAITQTQTAELIPKMLFESISNGIPESLNFSITFTIEQDEF